MFPWQPKARFFDSNKFQVILWKRSLALLWASLYRHSSTPPHTRAPAQSGGEWDVANPPRCHIWHSNPSIVLHSDLRACAIPNCDWRLRRSQLLATLHWTVLPENFSANCARINQRKKLRCVSFLYVGKKFVIDKVVCFVFFSNLSFWC